MSSKVKAVQKAIDLSFDVDDIVLVVRNAEDDFAVIYDSQYEGDYGEVECAFYQGDVSL